MVGWGPTIPLNGWYFQTSNILRLLCFIQLDMMYLRILRIFSDIFFMLFGIFQLYIGIDVVIWNTLFIIVDTIYLIPLVKQRMPVKLSKQEEAFYKTVEKFLTKFQFKMLIDNGEQRKYHVSGSQICKEGNPCDEVILFFRIPEDKTVVLYKDNKRIMTVQQGSYIGHIEFISQATGSLFTNQNLDSVNPSAPKMGWNITCEIESSCDQTTNIDVDVDAEEEIYDSDLESDSDYDPNSILCFKWDFKRMKTLFADPEHGRIFENGIYSHWLESVSEYILRQSNEIYENKLKKQRYIKQRSDISPHSSIAGLNMNQYDESSSTSDIEGEISSIHKEVVMNKVQSKRDDMSFTSKMLPFQNTPLVHSENGFALQGSLIKTKKKKAKEKRNQLAMRNKIFSNEQPSIIPIPMEDSHIETGEQSVTLAEMSKTQSKAKLKKLRQRIAEAKAKTNEKDRGSKSPIGNQTRRRLKDMQSMIKETPSEPDSHEAGSSEKKLDE